MINFSIKQNKFCLEYRADRPGNRWVWLELNEKKSVTISSVFFFDAADWINPPPIPAEIDDEYLYEFQLGDVDGEYVRINGQCLGIDNDVLMPSVTKFRRTLFAAERNVSIFGRIAGIVEHGQPIVVGGSRQGALQWDVFIDLLSRFPSSYELDRYADARVQTVLSAHLDGLKDARGRYENYLVKKTKGRSAHVDLDFLKSVEIEKYILIRNLIKEALATKKDMSEAQWQDLMVSFILLLFPKYIKVFQNVAINDYYSDRSKKTSRFIDIALLDANGNLDVIEVKKPFDDKILRKSAYRSNSIPTSELSGSIMQAEKYLFHLSKWGVKGEKTLTERYAAQLPKGMEIRISNPKAIIIVGRDQMGGSKMTDSQFLDFEIIKRKYANMIDIITYDDLLRRLSNTILALGGDLDNDIDLEGVDINVGFPMITEDEDFEDL